MYHRIFMDEKNVNVQRFLWMNFDKNKKSDQYVLQVLAFGPVLALSAAIYVKNRNAERLKAKYPKRSVQLYYNGLCGQQYGKL